MKSDGPVERDYLFAWAAFCGSLAAIGIAAMAWACRYGLPEPATGLLAESVPVAWLLINGPIALRAARSTSHHRFAGNVGVLILAVLAAVLATGWLAGNAMALPVIAVGVLVFALQTVRLFRMGRLRQTALAMPMAGLMTLVLSAAVWGNGYLSPTFSEGLVYEGSQIDIVFNAAVCNMVDTYGVPSIGLDGVTYLNYHTGSYCAMACLARLLDVDGLQVYNLTFPIVFMPLFLFSLQACGLALLRDEHTQLSFGALWIMSLIPLTILGGVLPNWLAVALATWNWGFVSESFCIGLIILFCAVAGALPTIRVDDRAKVHPLEWLVLSMGICLVIFAATLVKVSIGFVVVVTGVYFCLRRLTLWATVIAASWIGCFVVALQYSYVPQSEGQLIVPFHFVTHYVAKQYWALYLPTALAWVMVAILLNVKTLGDKPLRDLLGLIRSGKTVDIEFIVVLAGVSMGTGLLLRIENASAEYFVDAQRWVAMLLLISSGIHLLTERSRITVIALLRPTRARQFARWMIAIVLIAAVGTIGSNTSAALMALASRVAIDRGAGSVRARTAWSQLIRVGKMESSPPDKLKVELLAALRRIWNMSPAEKQETLLYVPITNRVYWDFYEAAPLRKAIPFLGPAVSGVAMIDAIPDPDPQVLWTFFGYEDYAIPTKAKNRPSVLLYREELLAKAGQLGFARVLVLDHDERGINVLDWRVAGGVAIGEK